MTNKEKNFVSAVVYVHNAKDVIVPFLRAVTETLGENFDHAELICVDDCSTDGSVELIKKNFAGWERGSVAIVHMSYFHGLELAMNAGVDFSIGDFVFEFDTPWMDYDTGLIMDAYRRTLEGYDIVSAAPSKRQRVSSRVFYRVFEWFSVQSNRLFTESFRVLSRRVINRVGSMNKTVPYRKAVYANCGLKTDTLFYQRETALGSTGKRDKAEGKYRRGLAVDSLILFTDVGYRFSVGMTILMMLLAVFMVAYSVVTYLVSTPVEGWTTTILFLSVAFFGLFAVLSVIIKYLQLLVDLVFRRKRYSFEGIEKL